MIITYVVPASLLYQAAQLLQPPEKVCFGTGIKTAVLGKQIIILTQLVMVEAAVSRVHGEPLPASVLRIQQRLQDMGMDIEFQFHSHPGRTKQATLHSPIDDNTARCWENGTPFIGAIFSEGGRFVRFFNHSQLSEVIVYGHCLKDREDPNLFELPPVRGEEMLAEEDQLSGLVNDRPAREIPLVESVPDPLSPDLAGGSRGLRQQPGEDLPSDGGWFRRLYRS